MPKASKRNTKKVKKAIEDIVTTAIGLYIVSIMMPMVLGQMQLGWANNPSSYSGEEKKQFAKEIMEGHRKYSK